MRQWLLLAVMWSLALLSVAATVFELTHFGIGYDARAYWLAWRRDDLYGLEPGDRDAFLYSPAFAQLAWVPARLPFTAFAAGVSVCAAVTFAWLLRPLRPDVALACWLMTLLEVVAGNVYWLLALAAVLGLRHPAAWTVAALTKITPCLGPVWFLVRREWRALGVSLAATGLVALASYAVAPGEWAAWASFLRDSSGAGSEALRGSVFPPLVYRLPVALAVVVWGALTGRAWTIPVAMVLATPVIGIASFTMLCAIPRLRRVPSESPSRPRPTADALP
ncbi:Protein of unknown function [Nocardioides exalbidus]|uniref:DUF2029 domain-containing protein n=2 Tax=Nocardioides exalbidus TaxID=402596 RepID=A0A1H5A1A4_9ACTN|nr:Protein of unknown function [Nocardioides exalbidus]